MTIISRPPTDAYRPGFDAVFGPKPEPPAELAVTVEANTVVVACVVCGGDLGDDPVLCETCATGATPED